MSKLTIEMALKNFDERYYKCRIEKNKLDSFEHTISNYIKGFVTEYICKETIENTIIDKINTAFEWKIYLKRTIKSALWIRLRVRARNIHSSNKQLLVFRINSIIRLV